VRVLLLLVANLVVLLEFLIIARIVVSYIPQISPYNPGVRLLRGIVDPVLRPFQRVLPTLGGIDFTPLLVLLLLQEAASILRTLADTAGFSVAHAVTDVVTSLVLQIILFFCILVVVRVMVQLFQADPFHPLVLVVRQITNPLVRPFSAVTPNPDLVLYVALAGYLLLYIVALIAFDSLLAHV
jgi:YggT family protein